MKIDATWNIALAIWQWTSKKPKNKRERQRNTKEGCRSAAAETRRKRQTEMRGDRAIINGFEHYTNFWQRKESALSWWYYTHQEYGTICTPCDEERCGFKLKVVTARMNVWCDMSTKILCTVQYCTPNWSYEADDIPWYYIARHKPDYSWRN